LLKKKIKVEETKQEKPHVSLWTIECAAKKTSFFYSGSDVLTHPNDLLAP